MIQVQICSWNDATKKKRNPFWTHIQEQDAKRVLLYENFCDNRLFALWSTDFFFFI